MELARLDKILCGTGLYSRSEARAVILSGGVTVDGAVVGKPETKVSRQARLCVRGQELDGAQFVYYMMNKPANYVSATKDELYPAVTRLLPVFLQNRGLFPVGRLDADVTGLLLLTDDGVYAHRVTAPRSEIRKTYEVWVEGKLKSDHIKALGAGTTMPDGTQFRPAELQIDELDPSHGFVTVTEGKYHEVKRLMLFCECPVAKMKRLSIGGLALDSELETGSYRQITEEEAQSCFI